MSRPIIVAVNEGPATGDAVQAGVTLARALDAPLVLAGVAVGPEILEGSPMVGWVPEVADPAWMLDVVRAKATEASETVPGDVPFTTAVTLENSVSGGIELLAEEQDAQLIVLGGSHRGLFSRIVDGDPTLGMLRHAPCAVLVCPMPAEDEPLWPAAPTAVGLAWDRTDEAAQALATAVEITGRLDGRLTIFHVLEVVAPMFVPPADPMVGAELQAARRTEVEHDIRAAVEALSSGVPFTIEVVDGSTGDELEKISGGVDLLVVGSRRVGPVRRVTAGSVSAHLAHRTRCPMLVVPRGVHATTDA